MKPRPPVVWTRDDEGNWVDASTIRRARRPPTIAPEPPHRPTNPPARAEKPVERCRHCNAAGYHLSWCGPVYRSGPPVPMYVAKPSPVVQICNYCGGRNKHYAGCYNSRHSEREHAPEPPSLPYQGPAFTHYKPWPIIHGMQHHLKPAPKPKSKRKRKP